MSETLVLSVGLDPSVLDVREAILRSAGYIVVSAMSVKQAIQQFQNGDFDLLVLCHTLPVKDRERMTCWIRASGSRIPVASIAGAPGDISAFSDATVGQTAAELLGVIKHLLARRFEMAAPPRRALPHPIALPRASEVRNAPVPISDHRIPPAEFHPRLRGFEFPQTA